MVVTARCLGDGDVDWEWDVVVVVGFVGVVQHGAGGKWSLCVGDGCDGFVKWVGDGVLRL